MSVPEWFLFLYFKYWYFHSLKRFWDCDFNFVNVLELHQSMENDKWYNKRVLIWRFTLVLIKINYGQIGDQKSSFKQQTQYFIQDSRSGGNQCFSGPNSFLPICPSDHRSRKFYLLWSDRHFWESLVTFDTQARRASHLRYFRSPRPILLARTVGLAA